MRRAMKQRFFSFTLITISLIFWAAGVSQAATKTVTADAAGIVTISVSDLSTTARYWEFSDGATKIRFFAVLGTNGSVRVAFDACEVCGGRLGYEQKGTDIQCRVCGRVFRIDEIGSKNRTYGCWPSYLPFTEKGKSIVIRAVDLRKGSGLFN
jgi:uncharacterized membrane protein